LQVAVECLEEEELNPQGGRGEAQIAAVEATGADAYVADRLFRKRELAFAVAARQEIYWCGKDVLFNGYRVSKFKAPIGACRGCPLREQYVTWWRNLRPPHGVR